MIRPEQRWHGAETMTCSTQRHNLYKPSNSPRPWLGPRLAQWPPKWTHYSPLLSSYTITVTCPELLFLYYLFPGGASRKGCACQCRRHRRRKRRGFDPWVRKIHWRRKWQPTPVFLPEKFHGQSILEGYSPRRRKESDGTKPAHTLPLHRQETLGRQACNLLASFTMFWMW